MNINKEVLSRLAGHGVILVVAGLAGLSGSRDGSRADSSESPLIITGAPSVTEGNICPKQHLKEGEELEAFILGLNSSSNGHQEFFNEKGIDPNIDIRYDIIPRQGLVMARDGINARSFPDTEFGVEVDPNERLEYGETIYPPVGLSIKNTQGRAGWDYWLTQRKSFCQGSEEISYWLFFPAYLDGEQLIQITPPPEPPAPEEKHFDLRVAQILQRIEEMAI